MDSDTQLQSGLSDLFNTQFTKEDLLVLSNKIGIDLDNLDVSTKRILAIAIVGYCKKRDLLGLLLTNCRQMRSDMAWFKAEMAMLIDVYFDHNQLQALADKLDIDYHKLAGEEIKDRAQPLIQQCENLNLLKALLNECRVLYPNVLWPKKVPSEDVTGPKQRPINKRNWIKPTSVFLSIVLILIVLVLLVKYVSEQTSLQSKTDTNLQIRPIISVTFPVDSTTSTLLKEPVALVRDTRGLETSVQEIGFAFSQGYNFSVTHRTFTIKYRAGTYRIILQKPHPGLPYDNVVIKAGEETILMLPE